ncbi:MAG: hypothetical protein ACRDBP_05095 [Luteolibacter sp.]
MLSADDHPGLFSFMVGMIVIVMAGVALSLVVDRRLSFSSGKMRNQRELTLERAELEGLVASREERSRLLESQSAKSQTETKVFEAISGKLNALQQRREVLDQARGQLKGAITRLEDDFSTFRVRYRQGTWSRAPGEKLGNLVLANGREYRDAVITRVTDVGLEIRHADGIARIQAPELDRKIQDRFQWNDEERRRTLKDEHKNLQSIPETVVEKDTPDTSAFSESAARGSSRSQPGMDSDAIKLSELRRLVVAWKSKVNQLEADRSEALSNSGFGNRTSVPGSLETWSAKAARLGNELARANSALAIAKSDLAVVAPGDPLLRPDPVRR